MSWVKDYKKPVSEPIKFESEEQRRKCIAENKRKLKDESAWVTAQRSYPKRNNEERREPAGTNRKFKYK